MIDTDHYHRVEDGLRYVAWRNNTFSLHVHVGVRGRRPRRSPCATGCGRSCPSCWRCRPTRCSWTAATRACSRRARRSSPRAFPAAASPEPFGGWAAWADYVDLLVRTNSIVEHTQLWWSVRPHHSFGTVEVRICDSQSGAEESSALAGLIVACVAQAAADHDEGVAFTDPPGRLIEENFWRAIRYGLEGRMIDTERLRGVPRRARSATG